MTNVKRWTPQQVAETKTYLESKPPLTWTREDHYLALEFVIQRYLPEDSGVTQEQYDARLAEMKTKVDRNIGQSEEASKAEAKEDPELAAWLKDTLKTRVEREEILSRLAHFDNEDEWYEQEKAIGLFKFYLDKPEHFEIDWDLQARMREAIRQGS